MSTYVFPAPPGAWGRTDQGVDFGSAGPVKALGAGKIIEAQSGAGNTGWPGLGTFILEKLAHPYQGHQYVYYAEDINAKVHAGQTVSAGQVIGQATGGSTGIELGWGSGQNNLALGHAGYSEGVQTAAGKSFKAFLQALASGKNVGATPVKAHTTSKVKTVATTPTTTPSQVSNQSTAAGQNPAASNANQQAAQLLAAQQQQTAAGQTYAAGTGHNLWNDLVFAFVGTAALSIIANLNERLGYVLLAIMMGFLFVWFLMHSGTIAGMINAAVPQTRTG